NNESSTFGSGRSWPSCAKWSFNLIFLLEKFRFAIKDSNKLHLWRFLYPTFTSRKPSISFGLERTGNDCPRQHESSVCHCYWYATKAYRTQGQKYALSIRVYTERT